MTERASVPEITSVIVDEDRTASFQFFQFLQRLVANTEPLEGSGSPEGVVNAIPGRHYIDTDNTDVYFKREGDGDTGWKLL